TVPNPVLTAVGPPVDGPGLRQGSLSMPAVAVPERTIADVARSLAADWTCEDFLAWPPDGFALAAAVLSESGSYRLIVSPPAGRRWPPDDLFGETWEGAVEHSAREWRAWAVARGQGGRRPWMLSQLATSIGAAWQLPLVELDEPRHWNTLVSLLILHAIADEACSGLGVDRSARGSLDSWATQLLLEKGTLSRLPGTRARVLPKSALPRTGMSIRSLSRNLALDRSETDVRWFCSDAKTVPTSRFSLLLVPYPARISRSDFRAIDGPLDNMDPDQYGFFEFAPRFPLDIEGILRIVKAGSGRAGRVDAVVLPESVLRPDEADQLRRLLHAFGVPHLIAGVRERATPRTGLGLNYAYVTGVRGGASWAAVQHKHHRWLLDDAQISQYHLERPLDLGRQWWEAIGIERRSLMFVTIDECLTLCPLICEDLAQPDPVASIIRQVGPSLVIGLLLDGPQLAERWPARYASVFADDPGSAVLTLTSLGMAQRSQPSGFCPSRSIALWKDAHSGIQELTLDEGAAALLLTATVHHRFGMTADGRSVPVAELLLEDVQQVRFSTSASSGRRRTVTSPPDANALETGSASSGDAAQPSLGRTPPDVRSAEAVYACDWHGRVVSWNKALEQLTGIAASESIGRPCWEVMRGRDATGDLVCHENCVVAKRVKRGRPVSCPPVVVETAGGPKWIEISTVIVREGRQPLVIHTAREATLTAPVPAG
ncbi:MAG TPA: PAS domain S-box protein, partial [Gaiellaceae bacterium]|nr:PAS domain S-box protein [Gaiellaceae bacterium]